MSGLVFQLDSEDREALAAQLIDALTQQIRQTKHTFEVPKIALSPAEAADALSISPEVVRRLANNGTIPAVRIGKRIMIPTAALTAWANDNVGETIPTTHLEVA